MTHKLLAAAMLFLTFNLAAQIRGTVQDNQGNPLPYVNIFVENTYNSTISNETGKYELNITKTGPYTVIFQYLGFKSVKRSVNADSLPFTLDVALEEENFTLNEVVINPNDNPAIAIIRNAIDNKKENSEKTARYMADFYSRGIFRIKDAPKTILGQKLDMFDDMLDSTRSGILYLSETVSRLTFQKPDKMKEVIIASKVSGNDNGFSFNNAGSVNFDLYENYLPFAVNVVSPIADNAFNYYRYKLEGTFFDENNLQISKIRVTPRRNTEPVAEGYIYIVDDSWAIYAAELTLTGKSIQTPALNTMTLRQNFSYNNLNKIWVKNTQTLDFDAGILGIKIDGKFTYVYNNFEFPETFEKKTFTKEVLAFEENANKKDDSFWEAVRPVPLTEEETNDYAKKDILQSKKKSQTYLDSIDSVSNKLGLMDIVSGYSYQNSFRKWSLNYDGILTGVSFNSVQGYKINTGYSFVKRNDDNRTYTSVYTKFDYGFSEERFRPMIGFSRKFNNINDSQLDLSAGSVVAQFNPSNPISPLINSISSLFFKDNYMKLYERNFARAAYGREVYNGLHLYAALDYSQRKPLYNTTNQSAVKKDKLYTSNNPLLPDGYGSAALEKHNLYKANITARINFAQEYWSRPDGKFNMSTDKYPTVFLSYEKAFAANEQRYEYDHLSARITYDLLLGNKGELAMNVRGGGFMNAGDISFVDYKHFNGNQTHIGQSDKYLNVYNLLPYYSASTKENYLEIHAEHNDKGYIMNKIPLLNKLQSTLVLGYHNLSVHERVPYHEFSVGLDNLGFGKFRMFRIDYVRAYQAGHQTDGIVFGLKFLNFVN